MPPSLYGFKIQLYLVASLSMGLLTLPIQTTAQTNFTQIGPEDEIEDEAQLFQSGINGTLKILNDFIAQTRQGKNLSDMTLGLFVMRLLGTLSGQDIDISKHLHANDRFIEAYLTDIFQYHSETEIAFFWDLAAHAQTTQQVILCEATANALNILRNIPNGKSSQSNPDIYSLSSRDRHRRSTHRLSRRVGD